MEVLDRRLEIAPVVGSDELTGLFDVGLRNDPSSIPPKGDEMDLKLELIVVPVSDVDRAVDFYAGKLGFNIDVDHKAGENFRVVQLTPPGSECSISVGVGISPVEPGTYQGLHLVVADIEEAIAELSSSGVELGEPFHFGEAGQTPGLDPNRADYGTFVQFKDPDGNGWLVQEVKQRAPGR
jgi:catechol 2,3-dioxygenase-like lactoylglutathione lyase family enzyme